jgi:hypothetical protein
MKLLVGAFLYLALVGTVIVAALAGLSAIERSQPQDAPVMARGDDAASRKARAIEDAKVDPNRVPVWIAATAKYQYTPVPVDPRPKPNAVIGKDARDAMAKAARRKDRRQDGLKAIDGALRDQQREVGSSLGFAPTRRDNDPFFRD